MLFYRLFFIALLAIAVGYIIGEILLVLLISAITLLIWHYHQLLRLSHWLWKDKKITPPQAKGSWENIFNGIYRLQKKNRKKNQQLIKLLSQFRLGAEALPDAALVLDSQYNIVWCNKLAQLILGLEWPKDSGQKIANLLRQPDFIQYLYQANYDASLELPISDVEGGVLEIRIIKYGNDQLLLIARDISHVRQLEVMRKDFVANISHELKTPLTVLQGYLEIMQTENNNTESAHPFLLMEQQTKRMQTMVEQLLTLSRIEYASSLSLDSFVDMTLMMKVIEEEVEVISNSHQLRFNIEKGIFLYGSELQLRSAYLNLIENAIQYTEKEGCVTVNLTKTNRGVEFSVIDSGIGIDAEHIPRITERFYRVDFSRSTKSGGSGLGLAIVKHVLSHYHTELQVKSQRGKGSQFSFIIPLQFVKND